MKLYRELARLLFLSCALLGLVACGQSSDGITEEIVVESEPEVAPAEDAMSEEEAAPESILSEDWTEEPLEEAESNADIAEEEGGVEPAE